MRRSSALATLLIGALTAALLVIGAPSSEAGPRTVRDAAAPAAAASWKTVHLQTFEGTRWPDSNDGWTMRDVNGPNVGVKLNEFATLVWDDNSTRAKTGIWSAHPNDGAWSPSSGGQPTYADYTDTWMRYGPFSLRRATDARLRFAYWLDVEADYDQFSYSYSCSNQTRWTTEDVSGQLKVWKSATVSLKPCADKAKVWIRFWFRSDYSNPSSPAPTGVWVDDVLVQKYSVSP